MVQGTTVPPILNYARMTSLTAKDAVGICTFMVEVAGRALAI